MAGNRRALCVGINEFQNYPQSSLNGCVNDVADMVGILKTYFAFADADIVQLTNAQATKANIMGNLHEMVDGAKSGKYSYLVFSISSHGTQVPDTSGDEPDRADEAFCPYDLAQKGDQWDLDHVIVDDELHDLFVQLPKSVQLEAYFDTCHSGTGLKAIDMLLTRRPRYLPPPSLKAFELVEGRSSRGLHSALIEMGTTHHILWAGCRADQTSADANIDGTWHGAFTHYLSKEMRGANNSIPRKELLRRVNADLRKERYSQVAQLECQATVRSAVPA